MFIKSFSHSLLKGIIDKFDVEDTSTKSKANTIEEGTNLDERRLFETLFGAIANAPQLDFPLDDVGFLQQSVGETHAGEFAPAESLSLNPVLEFQLIGSQETLHRIHGEAGIKRETRLKIEQRKIDLVVDLFQITRQ